MNAASRNLITKGLGYGLPSAKEIKRTNKKQQYDVIRALLSPETKARALELSREIFGQAPIRSPTPIEGTATVDNLSRKSFNRTGNKVIGKELVGHKLVRYYPEDIVRSARLVLNDYNTPKQQRRLDKLTELRRKGKGPPKKGAGKRASLKKR
uniref:Small ribosomal subunit protein mS33 n=1 Tax=Corethron hystrix TaxID=216773 RepID=A0A7S1BPW1_9STRA